jgi:putative SOS response-associated peptidase YedK
MCGRFTRSSPPQAIAEEFGVPVDSALVLGPRFNVCPTEEVLVVARGTEGPALGTMKWGLVPWFATDPKSGVRAINARAETLATTRTFREPFERRRCLVVADGFYEWKKVGDERQPYYIRLRSRRPFAFAGLWDRWKPKDGGAPLTSCAIVTCAPNGLMAPVHDRMPVIVPPDARELWLTRDTPSAELSAVLRPYPDDEMEIYAVSKRVSSVKNDDAECIRRVEPLADA